MVLGVGSGGKFNTQLKLRLVLYTPTPHAINFVVPLSQYINHYNYVRLLVW